MASLPPGLEVYMPLMGDKCARIPSTWRLQVVAEGQIDSYRCDVGEHTLLDDVIQGAAARFGWETHLLQLRADGGPLEHSAGSTIGSTALFGRKVTARRQA